MELEIAALVLETLVLKLFSPYNSLWYKSINAGNQTRRGASVKIKYPEAFRLKTLCQNFRVLATKNEILAHLNVKVFISHVAFGDQNRNAKRVY